jgi:hypothetical protein
MIMIWKLFTRFRNSSFAFTLELVDLGILLFAISLAGRVLTDVGMDLTIVVEVFQILSFLILGYGLLQLDKAFHTFKWLKELEKE